MSWQPGDVSSDARRAAEAAAAAAGVPLKEWFAETVRTAIIRELGRLPTEEEAPTQPLPAPPGPEPVAPLSTAEPDPPAPAEALSVSHPIPAAEPPPSPPIAEPEPLAPAAIVTEEPPAPPPIAEPEPYAPEPIVAAEPPAPSPIAEPEPYAPEPTVAPEPPTPAPVAPPAPRDAQPAADDRIRRVALGVQPFDYGLSSWLAARIQGLPTAATPAATQSAANTPPPSAPPMPSPPVLPPRPQLELRPTSPTPVMPTVPPLQPADRVAPAPATTSAPGQPAPAATPQPTVLPLSLPSGPVTTLPLASLRPARIRARRPSEVDAAIAMLAGSIASQGVREPILVRRLTETADHYEVVAGERRRLAAERAGRATLPAVIVTADDAEVMTLSLAENLGRGDFSPLDEARAYLRLLTEFRVSPGTLAQRLARERSHVALALRLLGLPPKVRQLIDAGRLAPAQAYALLSVPDPEVTAEQMIQAGTGPSRSSA